MATTPYPLPRETRESTILVGNGTPGPYGPTTFKIFDVLDIEVLVKPDGAPFFSALAATVTKTADEPFDTVSVTFAGNIPATTDMVIRAKRTHERTAAVMKGGALSSDQLEKELSKQATVLSEVRRDIDNGLQLPLGSGGRQVELLAEGHFHLTDADGNLVDGGSAADIQDAQENAAAALADRLLAEIAAAASQAAQPQAFPVNRTALAALADNVVNAYLKEPGFEGYFAPVDATDPDYAALITADTVGGEIKVKSGNPNLAYLRQRKNGDLFKTSEFGGGVVGLKTAMTAAAERVKLFGAGQMADVEINDVGTIAFLAADTGLIVPPNVSLLGLGKGKTVLNCAALVTPNLVDHATGAINSSGRRFMDVRPAYGSFDALYSVLPSFVTISVRKEYVDFDSAHGLAIGDIFIVYQEADNSWMATRPEYRTGDRFKVLGVDGNRVYVDHAFRDAYIYSATPGSEVRAYKQTVRAGRFGGFTIDTAGSGVSTLEGLAFNSCDGLRVDDIAVWDAGEQGFQFNQCFDAVGDHCNATTILSDGTTSVYPFAFRNSTKCRIKNGSMSGDWHSIDMGGYNLMGAVLNYDCVAENIDGFGSGQGSTGGSAFNMHGNSDLCGYIRCKGSGYIGAGRDSYFDDGNLALAGDATAPDKLVHAGEVWGGFFRVSRTKMYSNRNGGTGSTGGSIYLDINEAKAETFVQLWDNDIEMPAELQPVRLIASGSATFPISFDMRGRTVTPLATVVVRIVGGTNALTAKHFRMDGVYGVPSGVGFANSTAGAGGHLGVTEWKFPTQEILTTFTPAAAAVHHEPAVTYPHSFPSTYTPKVSVSMQDSAAGDKGNIKATTITTASYRPRLATGDGTNLTAAATVVLAVVR